MYKSRRKIEILFQFKISISYAYIDDKVYVECTFLLLKFQSGDPPVAFFFISTKIFVNCWTEL